MQPEEFGRWIFAVAKHLNVFADTPQLARLFAIRRSARDGELLLRIRGAGVISARKLEGLALDCRIPSQELPDVLRRLESTGLISVEKSHTTGSIERVRERILTEQEVFRSIAQLFEATNPNLEERSIIPAMQIMAQLPLTEEELLNKLVTEGFSEEDLRRSLELQQAFHLTRQQPVTDFGVTLLYNDYLWGEKIAKIGPVLARLPRQETEHLRNVIDEVRSMQGQSMERLSSAPKHIINLAAEKGFLDTTTIKTARGDEKTFVFSPHFYGYRAGPQIAQIIDPADQVRLFIASITYGVQYSIDFRLHSPIRFVERLIRDGAAGNATPIVRDYVLLERQGIVGVEERTPGRGTFILQKKDVVERALDVMRNGMLLQDAGGPNDSRFLITQNSFTSPEVNRLRAGFGERAGNTQRFDNDIMAAIREEAQRGTW